MTQANRNQTLLGVMGSPRKGGNTYELLHAMLGDASDRMLLLDEMRIAPCVGCHACWRGRACVHQDDMTPCFARIAASDAFIFGTPLYWYGPTALMKAFLDRFVYFNCPAHRPQVAGKPVALVIPFEEQDRTVADPLRDMFRRSLAYLEMPLVGELLVPGLTRKGEVLDRPEVLAEARALVDRLRAAAG